MADENKIRKRASYRFWREWVKFLKTNPNKATILKRIDDELDRRHAYGSETNAYASTESLNLVLKEKGL